MAKKTKKKATKKITKKVIKKKATAKKTAVKKKASAKTTTKKVAKAPKKTVSKATAAKVAVGKPVPDFCLAGTGGQAMSVSGSKGKKVVLYFYPKDDTPGCTLEGQDFSRLKEQFAEANTEVYGISRDSIDSHEKFCGKYAYKITLLSDGDEKVCNIFGVIKDKNMYGKMVRGIERSTFVIDADGVLRKEWRKVSVDGHAQQVLDAVKTI